MRKILHFCGSLMIGIILSGCNLTRQTETPLQSAAPTLSVPVGGEVWQPPVGVTWDWQLSGEPDLSLDVEVYDLDLFETDTETVAALHAQGRRVICYINVGAWEDWRPDRDEFPAEVLGNAYDGWAGERWLDIRRLDVLAPLMQARLDLCAAKGFDAIEPDNIEAYTVDSGFPLTYADQLAYNRWLAQEAHGRGLSIGLKNDPEQAADLLDVYDWALTEDCFEQGWCEEMLPFIQAGKAVLAAEYTESSLDFEAACRRAKELRFSLILKHLELDDYAVFCR